MGVMPPSHILLSLRFGWLLLGWQRPGSPHQFPIVGENHATTDAYLIMLAIHAHSRPGEAVGTGTIQQPPEEFHCRCLLARDPANSRIEVYRCL